MSLIRKKYKCCFIGNFGAGKTSFIRSVLGLSLNNIQSTLGIDFFTTTVRVKNTTASVTLWDTAGSERFRSLTMSYVRDSDIVFIIYDLTDRNALKSIEQGFRDLENFRPKVVAVVGNKLDLNGRISHDIHDAIHPWARQGWQIVTGTCSAKKPDTAKKILLRCLNMVVESTDPQNLGITPIRLKSRRHSSQKCCT